MFQLNRMFIEHIGEKLLQSRKMGFGRIHYQQSVVNVTNTVERSKLLKEIGMLLREVLF